MCRWLAAKSIVKSRSEVDQEINLWVQVCISGAHGQVYPWLLHSWTVGKVEAKHENLNLKTDPTGK